MKKIDAHAHIFERIASFGKCGELRPIGNGVCRWANGDEMAIIPKGYGDKEFMAETLLKIMDEEDVEKAILLQGSLYGFQNEYAMETAEKYPDRFKAAVTLDAFCKEADSILNHFINDLHAKVFKFEVSVGGGMMGYHKNFIIDGEPFGKIFEKISKVEKATLVLDIGSPFMESCQVEAVDRLAQKYPNLNIVVCHLLAPRREDGATLEKALPYLKHKNVWIDLSALPWNVSPEAYPYPTALKFISMAKEVLGTEKIIWGTDSPCVMTKFKYADLYNFIIESDVFTETELEVVFYHNAVDAYYLG